MEKDVSPRRKRMLWFGVIILTIKILVLAVFLSSCTKDNIDKSGEYLASAGVDQVFPASNAENIEVNPVIEVAFSPGTDPSNISASLNLTEGTVDVPGKTSVTETAIVFFSSGDLKPGTQYTATLSGKKRGDSGDYEPFEYGWKFKTGNDHKDNSLSVVSVDPPNLAKNVPTNTSITITLDKEITQWMKGLISVDLRNGPAKVTGSLSYSGKIVIFDPVADLEAGTLYSAGFGFGPNDWINNNGGNGGHDNDEENDEDEHDKSARSFNWSFSTAGNVTTGDLTPPVVSSVVPAANANSVAANATITVTFSEPVNPSTVTSSTFSLKQGSTTVPGSITCSANVATFTPSAALTGGTVYTVSVTTGVTDLAGNAMTSPYTWTFTTVAAPIGGISFATDVIPVLNKCNACHTHKWVTSSSASTFYTNLVNGGYVNPSSPTTSLIYTQINSGHASSIPAADRQKILSWITEGAKNN